MIELIWGRKFDQIFSFTYTHKTDEKTIHEKPGGQLGAAILILVIITSTIITKRDFFLAQLTKSSKTEEKTGRASQRAR